MYAIYDLLNSDRKIARLFSYSSHYLIVDDTNYSYYGYGDSVSECITNASQTFKHRLVMDISYRSLLFKLTTLISIENINDLPELYPELLI